jgi:hypothetical protein
MIVTGLAVAAAAWGVLMGVSPVLQIRRMVRQRSSRDVSIGYFAILLIGSCCGSATASPRATWR